jgi:hypothetical protein
MEKKEKEQLITNLSPAFSIDVTEDAVRIHYDIMKPISIPPY